MPRRRRRRNDGEGHGRSKRERTPEEISWQRHQRKVQERRRKYFGVLKRIKRGLRVPSSFPRLNLELVSLQQGLGLGKNIHDFPDIKEALRRTFGEGIERERLDGSVLATANGFFIVKFWQKREQINEGPLAGKPVLVGKTLERALTGKLKDLGIFVPISHPLYTFIHDRLYIDELLQERILRSDLELIGGWQGVKTIQNLRMGIPNLVFIPTPPNSVFVKTKIMGPHRYLGP